jgi:hypothetical protein
METIISGPELGENSFPLRIGIAEAEWTTPGLFANVGFPLWKQPSTTMKKQWQFVQFPAGRKNGNPNRYYNWYRNDTIVPREQRCQPNNQRRSLPF